MLTREQVRMARAALGWGVRDLAKYAGITPTTVSNFENGADAMGSTLFKMQRALEDGGVEFIPENGGGAGVRLKKKHVEEMKKTK